jgi:lycopene cyclase domain-containing protein
MEGMIDFFPFPLLRPTFLFFSAVTYLRFHWIFNIPLLVFLVLAGWREHLSYGAMHAMGYVLVAVFVFTTPWDNLAVRRGIWGFPPNKYQGRIGYLPVEEYLFFLLQSLNVMFGVRALFWLHPGWHLLINTTLTGWSWLCLAAAIPVWIVLGQRLRQWGRERGPRMNYVLHLAWFLPVIYLQWSLEPELLARHAGLLLIVTLGFGVYYTIADLVAVQTGLWFFDEKQITGVKIGGSLPWEEAAFFFLTSLLVAQSFLLLLPYYGR